MPEKFNEAKIKQLVDAHIDRRKRKSDMEISITKAYTIGLKLRPSQIRKDGFLKKQTVRMIERRFAESSKKHGKMNT